MNGNICRFGIIGTGNISLKALSGAREDPRFMAEAVLSRDDAKGAAFAEETGIPHHFTSLGKMLQSGAVDALYIATPNFLHCELTLEALEAGIPVLVEKPFAANCSQAGWMVETARRKGVLLMEAMKSMPVPEMIKMKEWIDRVGGVRQYDCSVCRHSDRYDDFLKGQRPHVFLPQYATGALMDMGVYAIHPLVSFFGRPDRIQSQGTVLSTGVDGQGTAVLSYPSMTARVSWSKMTDSSQEAVVMGDEATLRVDNVHRPGKLTLESQSMVVDEYRDSSGHSPFYYEFSHFMDCLEQGLTESPVIPLDASLETIRVMDEIRRQLGVAFPCDGRD